MKKLHQLVLLTSGALGACAAIVPAELRDARTAYDSASRGPAATETPAELHQAHEALLAAEAAWKDHPDGFKTLDLEYVAQRKSEIAVAKASIAREGKSKTMAEADLATAQAKMVERTRAELVQTKADLHKSDANLRTTQVTAAVVAGQLTVEQQAHKEADAKTTEARASAATAAGALESERAARADAERRAALSQAALTRLAAVREESRGLIITLSGSVLFRTDEATLLPEARVRLDQVTEALLQTKERTLVVEGYTDSRGSESHNLALSQQRASAVRDYLTERGYPSSQTSAVGYGVDRPIANNKTAEGRANNRRVQIVVQAVQAQR